MHDEFTAIVERAGMWFVAYCPEIPGANGQGKTKAECLKSLSAALISFWRTGGMTRCAVCQPAPCGSLSPSDETEWSPGYVKNARPLCAWRFCLTPRLYACTVCGQSS